MMLEKSHGLHKSSIGVGWLFWANNKWISEIASSPRLARSLRGVSLFNLLLYTLSGSARELSRPAKWLRVECLTIFESGVATWRKR